MFLNINIQKNTLIIRLDNIGDVLMSSPAFRIIKEQSHSKITLLTSTQGARIAHLLPSVDEVIGYDLPWLKNNGKFEGGRMDVLQDIVRTVKSKKFDQCFIFSVYSQSILSSALIPWLAGIPMIAGYSRENPYQLLTHWVVEKEPFEIIRHQLKRDLYLLKELGFDTEHAPLPELHLTPGDRKIPFGLRGQPFLILHPGVSEKKREYPFKLWKTLIHKLLDETEFNIVLTGDEKDAIKYGLLDIKTSKRIVNKMGKSNITELVDWISIASGMICVNTGPAHIAMCLDTPLVVLYAETNPQHTPWSRFSKALFFSIPKEDQSKNFIVQYVIHQQYGDRRKHPPQPKQILSSLHQVIQAKEKHMQKTKIG